MLIKDKELIEEGNKFTHPIYCLPAMLAIIPVKLSQRLPLKHLLPLGDSSIIERVYGKVSEVFETIIYSKIGLPVPYKRDDSENIMDLVYKLRMEYGTFALVGGDMVFFTREDLQLLLTSYNGGPVTPRGDDGNIEPMFSIYSGTPSRTVNLREALITPQTVFVQKNRFSSNAFFNINTREDYELAKSMLGK